jgi:hypothetical protein
VFALGKVDLDDIGIDADQGDEQSDAMGMAG